MVVVVVCPSMRKHGQQARGVWHASVAIVYSRQSQGLPGRRDAITKQEQGQAPLWRANEGGTKKQAGPPQAPHALP